MTRPRLFSHLALFCALVLLLLGALPALASAPSRVPTVHPSSITPDYETTTQTAASAYSNVLDVTSAAPQGYARTAPQVQTYQPIAAPQEASPQTGRRNAQEYLLGTGDRIRLTVYGEKDLSGDYDVSSTGVIALPLIGDVHAAGMPIRLFEQSVRQQLSQGYLKDPRVNAQVINYRPFFILGEVTKPGSYPYVNGMTILNAIALAGGYTYRADKDDVTVSRADDPAQKKVKVSEGTIVMPGDIIRVPERFF